MHKKATGAAAAAVTLQLCTLAKCREWASGWVVGRGPVFNSPLSLTAHVCRIGMCQPCSKKGPHLPPQRRTINHNK